MDPIVLLAMVDRCAVPEVPRPIVYAVALAESGGHRFVIRDNTTKTVHRFHSYSEARSFVKSNSRHSLDIGLMQVNTKAHRGNPARILSPCGNIRIGSEILEKDAGTAGGSLRSTLCLYHRGKSRCRNYPEKVVAFLPRSRSPVKTPVRVSPKRLDIVPVRSADPPTGEDDSPPDLADATQETDSTGSDLSSELDPQLKPADIDGFMGR